MAEAKKETKPKAKIYNIAQPVFISGVGHVGRVQGKQLIVEDPEEIKAIDKLLGK